MEPVSDNELRDWLLHRLDPARAEELERQLLLDDELASRLRDAENDLLDDLAQGRLDADESAAVHRHLLATPADRQRSRVAAALTHVNRQAAKAESQAGGASTSRDESAAVVARASAPASQRRSPAPRRRASAAMVWISAVAACLLLAVAAFLPMHRDSLQQGSPPLAQLPSITLLASAQRGGSEDSIALPQRAERVRLQLEVDAPGAARSARYDVVIADADRILFSASVRGLRTAGPYRFVEVAVPTRGLGPGKRRVTLTNAAAPQSVMHWDITTR